MSRGDASPTGPPTGPPTVIDLHGHIGLRGRGADDESVAECLRLARRAGIDRLINLTDLGGGGDCPDPAGAAVRASNDLACDLARRYPHFIIPFCFLNPKLDEQVLKSEIDRCIRNGPCRGIKLWIAVKASDDRLDPIMQEAAALGVPVVQHAWDKAVGQQPGESRPRDVADLARRHSEATIVMAHLAGCGWAGVAEVRECPNVLVDTAGGQPVAGLVEYAVNELGAERVVFGSDWPVRDFRTKRAQVEGACIGEEDKRLILGGNARRILGLAAKSAGA